MRPSCVIMARFFRHPHGNKDGPMAAQTSASSSRASANGHNGEPSVLSRSRVRCVSFSPLKSGNKSNTPPASTVAGTGFAGPLQPLIMIAAIIRRLIVRQGNKDTDRFVLSRSFYVQIHCPKRQRPGKAFSGFCKAMLRLPMPVWWAFCDAVRSRVFHLLADRMTMEGWLPLGCDGSRMTCCALRSWNRAWGSPARTNRHRRCG